MGLMWHVSLYGEISWTKSTWPPLDKCTNVDSFYQGCIPGEIGLTVAAILDVLVLSGNVQGSTKLGYKGCVGMGENACSMELLGGGLDVTAKVTGLKLINHSWKWQLLPPKKWIDDKWTCWPL